MIFDKLKKNPQKSQKEEIFLQGIHSKAISFHFFVDPQIFSFPIIFNIYWDGQRKVSHYFKSKKWWFQSQKKIIIFFFLLWFRVHILMAIRKNFSPRGIFYWTDHVLSCITKGPSIEIFWEIAPTPSLKMPFFLFEGEERENSFRA